MNATLSADAEAYEGATVIITHRVRTGSTPSGVRLFRQQLGLESGDISTARAANLIWSNEDIGCSVS